jgi:hypothetical protein
MNHSWIDKIQTCRYAWTVLSVAHIMSYVIILVIF